MLTIRYEQQGDSAAIRRIHEQAFNQSDEADIVEKVRASGNSILSLVATIGSTIVGHILFSPVMVDHGNNVIEGVGLGPLAVLPEHQGKGIGSALVEEGLALLKHISPPFVVVLGHSQYYPRFGFTPASEYGISSQWENFPEEDFMVIILDKTVIVDVSGVARYGDEFN